MEITQTQTGLDSPVAYEILSTASTFAIGFGFGGRVSVSEKALHVLLKHQESATLFQALLKDAPVAGQLCALVGLKLKDKETFNQRIVPYLSNDNVVEVTTSCRPSRTKVSSIAREIQNGFYDRAFRDENR